jgi:hypothetical protein
VLLPVPFSPQSRVRSKWIDTGSSQRRPLTAEDGLPRGLVTANGAVVGPKFEFAGLDNTTTTPGYVSYSALGAAGVRINYPIAVDAVDIQGSSSEASYLGQPAYRISLASAVLGQNDRYVQYEAELLNGSGSVLSSFRILSHTDRELLVDPDSNVLPNSATQLRVMAKFFKIVTNTSEGLGPTHTPVGGNPIPVSNVRIGFAFHQNPQAGTGRFPADEQQFLRDFNDPAFLAWVQANGAPRYVQWDVLFDMGFAGQSLTPSTPRPELHFLRLPFRF